MTKHSKSIQLMTDMALFAALGFVLDFMQGFICDFLPFWPNGGSVGVAMCAIFLFSYRYGLWGLLCGLITGFLTMLSGIYISPLANNPIHVFLQLGLDYFLGWTLVGLSGIFFPLIQKKDSHRNLWIILGVLIGGLGKFLCHFLAGMIYWPSDDKLGNFLYSLLYNGSYMLPSIILCAVVMFLIIYKVPKLLETKYVEEKNLKALPFYLDISFWTLLLSAIGFIYSLYNFCLSIETFEGGFSGDEVMILMMVIFIILIILSLIPMIKNILLRRAPKEE